VPLTVGPEGDQGLTEMPPISTRVLELDLPGDRVEVRRASTDQAIGALLAALREVGTTDSVEHPGALGR
jgi:hypothetical protein